MRPQLSRLGATSIPWQKRSKIKRDINGAERVLNADHFGLEKVKERITLEYLAVQQRMKKMKGPILCPQSVRRGSAKTSARQVRWRAPPGATSVRMSLGGVRTRPRSAATRRTYIQGSMPGKVIQGMKEGQIRRTRCSCWMRSTSSGSRLARRPVRQRSWRCSTPSRTRRSTITTSKSIMICRTCCSSLPRTRCGCRSR